MSDVTKLIAELRECHERSREAAVELGWGIPEPDESPWSRAADALAAARTENERLTAEAKDYEAMAWRLACLLDRQTGGLLSMTGYTVDVMSQQIDEYHDRINREDHDDECEYRVKLAEAKAENTELLMSLTELAPDPVLVEGSWIPVKEWPTILGNFMRDNDALGREAKGYAVALAEANRKIEAAIALHQRVGAVGGFGHHCSVCHDREYISLDNFGVWPCATVHALSTTPKPAGGNTDA